MEYLLGGLIAAIISYVFASKCHEDHPDLYMEPWLYALSGFFFGFIIPVLYCGFKVRKHVKEKHLE